MRWIFQCVPTCQSYSVTKYATMKVINIVYSYSGESSQLLFSCSMHITFKELSMELESLMLVLSTRETFSLPLFEEISLKEWKYPFQYKRRASAFKQCIKWSFCTYSSESIKRKLTNNVGLILLDAYQSAELCKHLNFNENGVKQMNCFWKSHHATFDSAASVQSITYSYTHTYNLLCAHRNTNSA